MEEERRKAYSEVIEILKLVDDARLEKIPFEFAQLIKVNSDPEYKPKISKDISLEDQNLRDETYAILAWIANKYWGEEIYSTEDFKKREYLQNEKAEVETETKNKENNKIAETAEQAREFNQVEEKVEQIKGANEAEEKVEQIKKVRNAGVYNDIEPECLGEYENNLPILTEELSWYKKIKEKVIKFFKILFRIKNEKEGVNE